MSEERSDIFVVGVFPCFPLCFGESTPDIRADRLFRLESHCFTFVLVLIEAFPDDFNQFILRVQTELI